MQSEMEAFHNTTSQTWPECPYSHPNQQHQSKKRKIYLLTPSDR